MCSLARIHAVVSLGLQVNVLDETYNPGLREAIKAYSQWPTIPQVNFFFDRGHPMTVHHVSVIVHHLSRLS